ncbi:MAG: hypothetical protein RIC55_21835 [Pirellulaceae bacterium]
MAENQPLIIQYTNLLHKHRDPNAAEVVKFLDEHGARDVAFKQRALKLNQVYKLKKALAKWAS